MLSTAERFFEPVHVLSYARFICIPLQIARSNSANYIRNKVDQQKHSKTNSKRDIPGEFSQYESETKVRSPGFEPGFSALLFIEWRADVLDQAFPSVSRMTGRQPRVYSETQPSVTIYVVF
jgi:hypothetical protein